MSDNNIVGIEYNRVTNTTSTDFPGHQQNGDYAWDIEKFKNKFEIKITNMGERTGTFDLIHIDTSISNAFRRIMIAEVPSVAVETVYMFMNTSVIQDEVLAQRIGLIPWNISPDKLSWVDESVDVNDRFTEDNTIVLSLDVTCTKNPNAPKDATDPNVLYKNSNVYAKDLKFEPHEPITGKLAEKFQKCFPPGVIGIDSKTGEAYVADARKDTVSREVLRHPEFDGKVKLGRQRDHFIFNVESTGAMTPDEIFCKSVRILKNKAEYLRNCPISQ
ncbi:DNA-directed RNA polymerases I and III subunit RPAC1 [Candida tropicalis]